MAVAIRHLRFRFAWFVALVLLCNALLDNTWFINTGLGNVAHGATIKYRLVFGSFQLETNALGWADRVGDTLGAHITVAAVDRDSARWYRVVSRPLGTSEFETLSVAARANEFKFWRDPVTQQKRTPIPVDRLVLRADWSESELAAAIPTHVPQSTHAGTIPASAAVEMASVNALPTIMQAPHVQSVGTSVGNVVAAAQETGAEVDIDTRIDTRVGTRSTRAPLDLDIDLGLQTRSYAHNGLAGQDRFQPSLSAAVQWRKSWDQDRQQVVVSPFLRLDGDDGRRSHFDLRELYWNRVAEQWELNLGVKQEFWGVTEFHHLVDILNQTDLVENIDGEDKLGQPMAHLSMVRDWGIVDFYLLAGFRERTFPGRDGRLRLSIHIDDDRATYDSGAENKRIDGAVRWSQQFGMVDLGVYHFSGTSREPEFAPGVDAAGELFLAPHYHVIEQTGVDAQVTVADWAFKLEAISRSGYDARYVASNVGFEKTMVGVFGTRSDLGVVVEYMYDERGDAAFNTLFENDLAVGARWFANDTQDTEALIGFVWDVETDEYIASVEASRRLGDAWTLFLEARVFGGGSAPEVDSLEALADPNNKSGFLQRDDLVQLELTRYF